MARQIWRTWDFDDPGAQKFTHCNIFNSHLISQLQPLVRFVHPTVVMLAQTAAKLVGYSKFLSVFALSVLPGGLIILGLIALYKLIQSRRARVATNTNQAETRV